MAQTMRLASFGPVFVATAFVSLPVDKYYLLQLLVLDGLYIYWNSM